MSLRTRLVQTAILLFSWFCMGFYTEVLGPAFPTLRYQVAASQTDMSRMQSGRSVGLFVGSLTGAVVHDQFPNKRRPIIGGSIIAAGVLILIPAFCRSLWLLAITLFLLGVCRGLHTTGSIPLMVDTWGSHSPGPLNFLYASFGIGAALAPQLVYFFPLDRRRNTSQTFGILSGTAPIISKNTTGSLIDLGPSFGLITSLTLLCGILLLLLPLLNRFMDSETIYKIEGLTLMPESKIVEQWIYLKKSRRSLLLGLGLAVSLFIFFLLTEGGDRLHRLFFYSYGSVTVKLRPADATLLDAMFWVALVISQLTSGFVLMFISPEALLSLLMLTALFAATAMLFAPGNVGLFWAASSFFVAFKSPLAPTALSVLNDYVEVTGCAIFLTNCAAALGAVVSPWLIQLVAPSLGSAIVPYTDVGHMVPLLAAGGLIILLGQIIGFRFEVNSDIGDLEDRGRANQAFDQDEESAL